MIDARQCLTPLPRILHFKAVVPLPCFMQKIVLWYDCSVKTLLDFISPGPQFIVVSTARRCARACVVFCLSAILVETRSMTVLKYESELGSGKIAAADPRSVQLTSVFSSLWFLSGSLVRACNSHRVTMMLKSTCANAK